VKINRNAAIPLAIIILVLGGVSFFLSTRKPPKERPNVLFILVDTLRSDHLGCYGYKKIKTPAIDSLAKNGTLFKNVITQAPLTFPSHSSFFTSTYPQYNKVRDNGSDRLDDSAVTLAEILQENGYITGAFVSTFVLDSRFGLDQGFQTYDDQMEKKSGKKVIKFMDEERTADKVTDAAIKWLRANKDKKFFLWVHYYDPHTIYNPPSPYKEIYKDNPYDGEIAFTDEHIGVLLSELKDLKIDKNTFIIFASDHGESLGEHGENGHAVFIYDTTLKVPLIFSYPGVIPEGKVVEKQVRLIDIMPSLLDYLHIKKNREIQGTSLAGLIRGALKKFSLPAYSESFYGKIHFNWDELRSFHEGDWKYIKSREPELYNIKDDPDELFNLAEKRSDLIKELDKKLDKFLKKTSSELEEAEVEMDEETRQKLMSLGYIQGSIGSESRPIPRKMVAIMQEMSLADRMANEGLIKEAIEKFNEILKIDTTNIEAYIHLAQCYKELGEYDNAIRHFKKAASFKPDNAEVHNGLGNIYKSMGRVDGAFEEFKVAFDLDPDDPMTTTNIGWCYQQKLEMAKAMEYYNKALALDSGIATAHANLGICYRLKGNLRQAIEELHTAIKNEPELAFAHSELGACMATKGDIEEAIRYCKKGIELDPEGLDGYNNLAVCYERKGEHHKAVENYLKALEIEPWNAFVYCNLGNAYAALKEFDKARESYKKALELNPNFKKAEHSLKLLQQ